MTRHGVPPIAARHLQEAIVGSTLMYRSEVSWRDPRGAERTFQKSTNRMARASLGVLSSTPIAFLQAEGGSLPARARLEKRKTSFTIRLASALGGPHAALVRGGPGRSGLGGRLRERLGSAAAVRATIERSATGQGRTFPGLVVVPPVLTGEEKERRLELAVEEAKLYERDPDTVWTDGSRLGSVGVGGGVAWYEAVTAVEAPVEVDRRGVIKIGDRKARGGRTYQERHRPFRGARSGWRGAGFGSRHEAYDAELAAVTYGLLHLIRRKETRKSYTISTIPRPP